MNPGAEHRRSASGLRLPPGLLVETDTMAVPGPFRPYGVPGRRGMGVRSTIGARGPWVPSVAGSPRGAHDVRHGEDARAAPSG
ncbi:hypothetical protein [Streptomyces bluensis]|uniref:hypothetical protein n=1 Tax=Streptomyces bluensis TaxID=33897 RepID=UPI0016752DB2|nr:hypothetical protein [Streptomyces bluensis]GGZ52225.1 hypothetical protein GCM10010344_17860 [Streptomyces bluensis]